MRRAAKVDANQGDVVKALLKIGCRVRSLAPMGQGVPDLLVARSGRLVLLEVKDGSLPPSARKLTRPELDFYNEFFPHVVVVKSAEEAINAMVGA